MREAAYEGEEWVAGIIESSLTDEITINGRGDLLICDEIGMLRTDKKLPLFRITPQLPADRGAVIAGRAVVVGTGETNRQSVLEPPESLRQRIEFIL